MNTSAWSYGNPYASVMFPRTETTLFAEWAPTGHRRSRACYPFYVDAKSANIIISERDGHRLQVFDCFGKECPFEPFGTKGHYRNQFLYPTGITTTACYGAQVICADSGNRRIVYFNVTSNSRERAFFEQTLTFGQQVLKKPMGLELDPNINTLYVTDQELRRVTMHSLTDGRCFGELRPHAGYPFLSPTDVTIDHKSRIYVTDRDSHCVQVFDHNGQFLFRFGSRGSGDGQFCKPWGICFDRQSRLFVSEEGNNRVQMFAPDGRYLRVIVSDVYMPKGISITVHENLAVTTSEPYDFLKILKYQ